MAIGFGIASRNWWRAQIKGGLFPSFSLNFDTIGTDFTFTRNSFATRVNEFGLIETVTNLGSDLVENGSFDELGSEQVTNGDFENGSTNWNIEAVWTIEDGVAKGNGANGSSEQLVQSGVTTVGKTYKVTYDIVDYVSGSVFMPNVGSSNSGNGTYNEYIIATQTDFKITGINFNGSIDNVSVKQVDPNDDWSLGSDWVIQDNKLTYGGNTSTDYTRQLGALTNNSVGKEYIINFEVLDSAFTIGFTSSSSFFDDENGNIIKSEFNVGAHTIKAFSTNSATDFRIYGYTDSGNGGSIDNVSVQEVLEDDVPRIDYTGSTFDVPVLGEELVTNGNFDTDSDWTKVNSTISDGKGNLDSTSSTSILFQQNTLTVGKTYKATFDVSNYNSVGTCALINSNGNTQFEITSNGNADFYFTHGGTSANLSFRAVAGGVFSIDNVSVKEVTAYTTTDKGAFLLEPISTNNVTYSEDFSNSWTKLGTPTITDNYGTSPDGTQNSTRIQGNSSTVIYLSNAAATTNFSRSIYIKATSGSGTIQALSHNTNTNNIFNIDENWQKIDINSLTSSSGNNIVYAVDMRGASTDIFDIEIWGCQEERGIDYATSYIPTSGTTVTRAQETCVDATPTINSLEGVLYVEISALVENDGIRLISLNDGTSGNIVQLYYSNSANKIICQTKVGSATQSSIQYVASSQTDTHKVALKYKENDFALWVDGVEIGTDLVGSVWAEGTLNQLDFDIGTGALPFYGRTKDLRIYDKALTDDELINLTTI